MPNYLLLVTRREVRIAQQLLAKTLQFSFISSERQRFCLHLLKVKEAVENFKNAQRFFSYFCSFQPYHLQPDSNWCISPFNGFIFFAYLQYKYIYIYHFVINILCKLRTVYFPYQKFYYLSLSLCRSVVMQQCQSENNCLPALLY